MKDDSPVLSRARTWDAFFANNHVAEFRRRLYRDVYGEEYLAEADTDGYITRSELRQIERHGGRLTDVPFKEPAGDGRRCKQT